ncbi:unnamed protein product [Brassicogethes aeneus]|uniref:F-box only protein 9 n=1 Tax=Brassicogethes aeneus TaxID=1431903 RepID=A0A9P0AXA8_BRAAE|nr:unnamed protein product [Brassicogethes aeneus]
MDKLGQNEINSQSDQPDPDVKDALASFREKWQKELRISNTKNKSLTHAEENPEKSTNNDLEEKAKSLFLKGIEMERSGKLYEAIQFYRRAVQIVPDIEFRLDAPKGSKKEKTNKIEEIVEHKEESDKEHSDNEEIKEGMLLPGIQRKMAQCSLICLSKYEQSTTHISSLPIEIIFLILKWLVSNDLDLKSLETFSAVCRGFYLCARDPEIWRLACLRVWGLNCDNSPGKYLSWRNMFIERARVQFNGCYISKTTYIRHGENSFQDTFYRPWYMVTYFRYLRFFPDSKVLMLTSADEPSQCVGNLKNKNAKSPILTGYYRISDDKITVIVQNLKEKAAHSYKKNRKHDNNMYETAEQTFHMEFEIKNYKRKRNVQLVWSHYSVYTRNMIGDKSTCDYDLVSNTFPPLWFSRVKSYTLESDSSL